jgi:hypothetical protein
MQKKPSSFNMPANTTIDVKGAVFVKTTGHEKTENT